MPPAAAGTLGTLGTTVEKVPASKTRSARAIAPENSGAEPRAGVWRASRSRSSTTASSAIAWKSASRATSPGDGGSSKSRNGTPVNQPWMERTARASFPENASSRSRSSSSEAIRASASAAGAYHASAGGNARDASRFSVIEDAVIGVVLVDVPRASTSRASVVNF